MKAAEHPRPEDGGAGGPPARGETSPAGGAAASTRAAASTTTPRTRTTDLALLLVEDDPVDREIVRRHLVQGRVPARVVEAHDLAAAEAALAERFDCVLLDLELPDGGGLDFLARHEAGVGLGAPVVVLTGRVEDGTATRCLQAGAQDYLVKGEFDADALARAIRHARERWRLLAELRAQRRELARSNEELERFAHVASHDLQEPLRTMSALCGLLEGRYGEALDERGREYVRRIRGAGQRMQRLIRDLLDLSRLQLGPLETEEVSLDEVVEQALADLAVTRAEVGARVDVALPLGVVRGGRSHLSCLFVNLLTNSLRFRHPERPPVVRIASRHLERRGARRRLEVTVEDNGVGFEPEQAELVFMPFKRLQPPEQGAGTGIGLAHCRAIAQRYGWELSAEGRPGEGATFRLGIEE